MKEEVKIKENNSNLIYGAMLFRTGAKLGLFTYLSSHKVKNAVNLYQEIQCGMCVYKEQRRVVMKLRGRIRRLSQISHRIHLNIVAVTG